MVSLAWVAMGWGGRGVSRCQDPCVLLCSLLVDTLYFFGDNNFTEWATLFRHYSPPTFGLLGTTPAYSFGIAGGYHTRPGDLEGWSGERKLGLVTGYS